MNEQPTQSTPIYIRWKSNPNWDVKEAALQTVCRDQRYRYLGAIVDCPELNITKYKRRLCSLTNIKYCCALWQRQRTNIEIGACTQNDIHNAFSVRQQVRLSNKLIAIYPSIILKNRQNFLNIKGEASKSWKLMFLGKHENMLLNVNSVIPNHDMSYNLLILGEYLQSKCKCR